MVQPTDDVFIGLPQPVAETVLTGQYFEAMDNFVRTFAFRPTTRSFSWRTEADPRVIHAKRLARRAA